MILRYRQLIVIGALCLIGCDSYRSLGPSATDVVRPPTDVIQTPPDGERAFMEGRITAISIDNYWVFSLLDAWVKGDSIVGYRSISRDHMARFAMPLSRASTISTKRPTLISDLRSAHFGTSPIYGLGGWISLDAQR